eukprot:5497034-Pyramimonas_sp.AAC.1
MGRRPRRGGGSGKSSCASSRLSSRSLYNSRRFSTCGHFVSVGARASRSSRFGRGQPAQR